MSGLLTAIPTGITAFAATNLDDLVILTLLFSQVDAHFRRRHIVAGQYLGFSALVVTSLLGFFGGLLVPIQWIGWLGFVPIAIGINRLLTDNENESDSINQESQPTASNILSNFLSPQTCGVAAITFANGSDNISIYLPLFAKSNGEQLGIILAVFFTLVGVWCYVTHSLTQHPVMAEFLARHGNTFVPFVLIGLGCFIILDSNTLSFPLLTAIAIGLGLLAMLKRPSNLQPVPDDVSHHEASVPSFNEFFVFNQPDVYPDSSINSENISIKF
jgi:cadmium resistance transport/sequestration family protein